MQQTVSMYSEQDFTEGLEAELPLAFRLRRSWSSGNILDLRKASEDDSTPCPDDASCVDLMPRHLVKFIDDSASTCIDDSRSDYTGSEDCSESLFPRFEWADEVDETWETESLENHCATPPGQWTSKLAAPPGQLQATPGKMLIVSFKCAKSDEPKSNRQKRVDRKYRRLRLREQAE
jgi:hypothetical protein